MGPQETLDNLAKDLRSSTKLKNIGSMAVDVIRGHLYKGEGFEPLSPATAAYRGQGLPLQDTGALRDSISYEVTGSDTVSIGTTKPYAAIQNNGGTITAKKNWLWIPAAGTRKLQRRYGYSPTEVCNGLKSKGYSIFRIGRTVCYRHGKGENAKNSIVFFLKKSVSIPKREFFYITEEEAEQIISEVVPDEIL